MATSKPLGKLCVFCGSSTGIRPEYMQVDGYLTTSPTGFWPSLPCTYDFLSTHFLSAVRPRAGPADGKGGCPPCLRRSVCMEVLIIDPSASPPSTRKLTAFPVSLGGTVGLMGAIASTVRLPLGG